MSPIIAQDSLRNATLVAVSFLSPNIAPTCERLSECRTLVSIVWSCLSVIIACTWTAVHPNVPSPDYGFWKRLRTRIGITFVGLIAPELILFWAMLQWRSAKWTKKKLEEFSVEDQTRAGSDAIVMHDGTDDEQGILLESEPSTQQALAEKKTVRPAGWSIVHGFSLLIGWFKRRGKGSKKTGGPVEWSTAHGFLLLMVVVEADSYPEEYNQTEGSVTDPLADLYNQYWSWVSSFNKSMFLWRIFMQTVHVILFPIIFLPAVLFQTGAEIISDCGLVIGSTKTVPPFYSHWANTHQPSSAQIVFGPLAITLIFGGIHLAAWSSHFPTSAEKSIWHLAALGTVVLPSLMLVALMLQECLDVGSDVILVLCSVSYTISRMALMIQAFVLLRSLPPSAYQTVQWTTFIPHI